MTTLEVLQRQYTDLQVQAMQLSGDLVRKDEVRGTAITTAQIQCNVACSALAPVSIVHIPPASIAFLSRFSSDALSCTLK